MIPEVLEHDTGLPSWRRANPTWGEVPPTDAAETPDRVDRRSVPRGPAKLADMGVPPGLLEDLFMRRVLTLKRGSTSKLATDLAMTMSVVQELADSLRDRNLIEYLGMDGRDYEFALTRAGEEQTASRLIVSRYSGFAPVSLAEYTSVVCRQQAIPPITKNDVREAMDGLICPDHLIDSIGAALLNDGAVFIYGPPGTGKTSLTQRMGGVVDDPVLVPHCIEFDGDIITVFDPGIHEPVAQPKGLDPRWVACKRPFVLVGGELGLNMLELGYDAQSGVYSAPRQLLANNGVFAIDDFGRQRITPEEILNRWIVPMSRGVDYLHTSGGATFAVPFAVKLVISSNLDPNELGDEAFLRRLRTKISVGTCSDEEFDEILRRAAESYGVALQPGIEAYLRGVCIDRIGQSRPYVAIDFCDLMRGICSYEELPKTLDTDMVDHIAGIYFVDSSNRSD